MTARNAANGAEAPTALDTGIEYDAFKYGAGAPSAFTAGINAVGTAPCTGALGAPGLFVDVVTAGPAWSGQAQGQIDNDGTRSTSGRSPPRTALPATAQLATRRPPTTRAASRSSRRTTSTGKSILAA
jgi:hypothetical protein